MEKLDKNNIQTNLRVFDEMDDYGEGVVEFVSEDKAMITVKFDNEVGVCLTCSKTFLFKSNGYVRYDLESSKKVKKLVLIENQIIENNEDTN